VTHENEAPRREVIDDRYDITHVVIQGIPRVRFCTEARAPQIGDDDATCVGGPSIQEWIPDPAGHSPAMEKERDRLPLALRTKMDVNTLRDLNIHKCRLSRVVGGLIDPPHRSEPQYQELDLGGSSKATTLSSIAVGWERSSLTATH
jgi:hypothetical protein